MRKKLFAVIMSAMMMITFMPAMAFAGAAPYPGTPAKTYEGYFNITNVPADSAYQLAHDKDGFHNATLTVVYDGQKSAVSYIPFTKWGTRTYTSTAVTYVVTANGKTTSYGTTAPEFVNAGVYDIYATTIYSYVNDAKQVVTEDPQTTHLTLTIDKRQVVAKAAKNVTLTKDYDGKGFTIEDSFFQISALEAPTTATEADKKWYAENTGLVAGDKLILKSFTTPADVDTYKIDWNAVSVNTNYTVNPTTAYYYKWNGRTFEKVSFKYEAGIEKWVNEVKIVQADNNAAIASQELTIKRGSSKAVKFSTTWGTAKLTKLSGNTKISVKNGKIKVAKSCKKGTFKVKVKCAAAGTKNWVKASRNKTLTIIVK